MKKLIMMLALGMAFVSTAAMAEYCSYELQGPRGMIFDRFTEYGYDRFDACQNAQQECERAQYRRQRDGLRPGICMRSGSMPGPIPRPGRFSCVSELHRGNGSILRTFVGRGMDMGQACKEARRDCELEAARARRGNRYGSLYCTTNPNGRPVPGPGPVVVSRSCSVELVSPRFGLQQVFNGYATGAMGSGVQERACDNAMSQCQSRAVRRQYCRRR
jgi:hypothetical protein